MERVNTPNKHFRSTIYFFTVLLAWTLLAPFLAKGLVVEKLLDHADVMLVLAGSTAYVERTQKAALIYKQGVAHKILLTNDKSLAGWSQTEQRLLPFIELATRELIAQGVPDHAIEILAPEVSGTIAEAEVLCKLASSSRWKSLLIVTSAYHTRRALRTFENVFAANGVETRIGIVSAVAGQQTPQAAYWWFSWNGWRDVAGEYVKSVFYYFNY